MPLWHAFVVFCIVFCGSVDVHALMKKPPSFWRVVLVFIKWLESPNGANIFIGALIGAVLTAIGETLEPREAVAVLRRTPIVVTRKT